MRKLQEVEVLLAVVCVAAVSALWQHSSLLFAVLGCISSVFIWRSKYKHPFLAYGGAALGGALSESIAIYFGAWTYTAPQLLYIPLWLPLLWGNAALFIIAMTRDE